MGGKTANLIEITGAYHESGHAVVATYFGANVHELQIFTPERRLIDWCGFKMQKRFHTLQSNMCITMAGHLAELKKVRMPTSSPDADIMVVIQDVFHWDGADSEGDTLNSIKCLRDHHPEYTPDAILKEYRKWEQITLELLKDQEIWPGVGRVARRLLMSRRMDAYDIENELGDELMSKWTERLNGDLWSRSNS